MRKILFAGVAAIALAGCNTTPEALSSQDIAAHASQALSGVTQGQELPQGQIDLYEAMARALKYNLEHRVSMMEADLAREDYDLSRYDQLPQIVANAGYYSRNNESGSSSLSLLSGRESLEPSTSTEKDVLDADMTVSWNILDFGLSYVRAQQLGSEALIVEERRRKAIIQIMEDVHRAYWRAASAQRLTERLTSLENEVKQAFDSSRSLYQSRRTAPMPALSYQRELNDITAQAQKMQRELTLAKIELASLMNMAPGQAFSLSIPSHMSRPKQLHMGLDDMISTALNHRPEMRESAYLIRIGEQEMKKALLESLPGLKLYAGGNQSSNDFLYNSDWTSVGAQASWNLMKVFTLDSRKSRANAQITLEQERALATAMAVMTQVNVARARYEFLQREYDTAATGTMVQSDILTQIETLSQSRSTSQQTLVRERMNTLISEARRDAIHAEMQESAAQIYTVLGYDPYASDIKGTESIAEIAQSLRKLWQSRSQTPGADMADAKVPTAGTKEAVTSLRYTTQQGAEAYSSQIDAENMTLTELRYGSSATP